MNKPHGCLSLQGVQGNESSRSGGDRDGEVEAYSLGRYGGRPDLLQKLPAGLPARFVGRVVAYMHSTSSSSFGPLTEEAPMMLVTLVATRPPTTFDDSTGPLWMPL